MSERSSKAPEIRFNHSGEQLTKQEHDALQEASKKAGGEKHKHLDNIEQIRHQAHEQARSADALKYEGKSEPHKPSEVYVTRELKAIAYNRLLNRARKQMSPPVRLLSRAIHQPTVDVVSQGLAKTIARPSGMLGGGILALAGTLGYYFMTKHYGYSYSYFVFLLLLGGGFIAGWLVEFGWRLTRRIKP